MTELLAGIPLPRDRQASRRDEPAKSIVQEPAGRTAAAAKDPRALIHPGHRSRPIEPAPHYGRKPRAPDRDVRQPGVATDHGEAGNSTIEVPFPAVGARSLQKSAAEDTPAPGGESSPQAPGKPQPSKLSGDSISKVSWRDRKAATKAARNARPGWLWGLVVLGLQMLWVAVGMAVLTGLDFARSIFPWVFVPCALSLVVFVLTIVLRRRI
jgi:hypothetical protein